MIYTYYSNSIINLKNIIKEIIIKNESNNIFESENIIIQNKYTAQWLQISLAKDIGFICNLNFIFINNFFIKIFQLVHENRYIYNKLNTDVLIWTIMSTIYKYVHCKELYIIKEYLRLDVHQNKLIQLSFKIAHTFQKYITNRKNIIDLFKIKNDINQIKNHKKWQLFIWNKIVKYKKKKYSWLYNEYEVLKELLLKLKKKNNKYNNITKSRLFIFNINILPINYLKIIKKLEKYFDIYILFYSPSKYIHKKNKNKKKNKLLKSWDKISKNYISYIKTISTKIKYKFQSTQANNILQNIQKDIFYNKKESKEKYLFNNNDNSISIHICQNERHEIEVLHKYLLKIIEKYKKITLNDIIIVSPNIMKYEPFIDGIFYNYNKNKTIKYNLVEKKINKEIIKKIIKILNINNINLDLNQIFNLLEEKNISKKFNMNKEKISFIKILVQKSNIHSGLLNISKYCKIKKYTWKFGIKRILLGKILEEQDGPWENIYPYNCYVDLQNNTIDNFQEFIKKLTKWEKKLSYKYEINKWENTINDLIKDFFIQDSNNTKYLLLIKTLWNKIIKNIKISKIKEKIHINSLLYILKNKINKKKITKNILFNKINFTSLSSIPLNPYKIVCLIGMNHNSFPKKEKKINFDLMKYEKKKFDPNKENYDKYLFLKLILNTKKKIYISYTQEKQIINDDISNQSNIITELSDYILNNFHFKNDLNISFMDNQNLIKKHLYNSHKNILYIDPIVKYQMPKLNKPNLLLYNNENENINFKNLLEFWYNPIKKFINTNLKIKLKKESLIKYNENEKFNLNQIEKYKISKKILDYLVHGRNIDKLYLKYDLSGDLPYNNFGKTIWNNIYIDMKNISKNIINFKKKKENIKFKIKIKKLILKGSLNNIYENKIIKWTPSTLNIKIIINLWLEHLIYSSLGHYNNSYIFAKNNHKLSFLKLDNKVAKLYLKKYIQGYLEGLNKPLILPIKSCWAWINTYFIKKNNKILINKDSKNKAIKNFYKEWYGNKYYLGEKNDTYIKHLIKEINSNKIKKICKNSKKWLLPIIKFSKIKKIKNKNI